MADDQFPHAGQGTPWDAPQRASDLTTPTTMPGLRHPDAETIGGGQVIAPPPPVPGASVPVSVPGASAPAPASPPNPGAANWMAVTAMILIVAPGLLGLAFALMALQAVKAGTATNKGLAVAAVWIHSIALALGVAVIVWLMAGGLDQDRSVTKPIEDVRVGECIEDDWSTRSVIYAVDVVSCDRPHHAQLYFDGQMEGFDELPSEDELWAYIDDRCLNPGAETWISRDLPDGVWYWPMAPTARGWSEGDKGFQCFLFFEDPVTESFVNS